MKSARPEYFLPRTRVRASRARPFTSIADITLWGFEKASYVVGRPSQVVRRTHGYRSFRVRRTTDDVRPVLTPSPFPTDRAGERCLAPFPRHPRPRAT